MRWWRDFVRRISCWSLPSAVSTRPLRPDHQSDGQPGGRGALVRRECAGGQQRADERFLIRVRAVHARTNTRHGSGTASARSSLPISTGKRPVGRARLDPRAGLAAAVTKRSRSSEEFLKNGYELVQSFPAFSPDDASRLRSAGHVFRAVCRLRRCRAAGTEFPLYKRSGQCAVTAPGARAARCSLLSACRSSTHGRSRRRQDGWAATAQADTQAEPVGDGVGGAPDRPRSPASVRRATSSIPSAARSRSPNICSCSR